MKKTPGTLAVVRIQEGENDVVYLTPRNAMNSGIALKCYPRDSCRACHLAGLSWAEAGFVEMNDG